MNTEHIFQLLVIYMLFNVYTDLKTLKTKNVWHLLFFVLSTLIAVVNGVLLNNILAILISLCVGVAICMIPKVTTGAGDIKMLVIISSLLQNVFINNNILLTVLITVMVYMFLSTLIQIICKLVYKMRGGWGFYTYRVTRESIVTPEAVPLFFTVCIMMSCTYFFS